MEFRNTLRKLGMALLALSLALPSVALDNANDMPAGYVPQQLPPMLSVAAVRPRMSPELALQQYEARLSFQTLELGESADVTTITADLPGAAKHGRYRLRRIYAAPKTLAFKTIDFVGDGFVKSNVITRLLQSEADHVKKDRPGDTAIANANYRFSYKGTETVNGREAYAFQVKPRQKRAGLFKGRVYIDAYSGAMLRAEGRIVKSPSLFIKNIEFVQDYAQIGDFTLVSHIHSVAETRIIGKAVVDISHDSYQVRSIEQVRASAAANQALGL